MEEVKYGVYCVWDDISILKLKLVYTWTWCQCMPQPPDGPWLQYQAGLSWWQDCGMQPYKLVLSGDVVTV